ncbi:MAG: peroxiredoxin [Acidobacteria bacterium]|nr:peroxiredoxin [Acidobacteriota bacterium]
MRPGDIAPDFSLPDQDGLTRTLSTMLASGPVVLFFYPAALSKGCTKESCHFRDLGAQFAAVGAQRIGISMDSVERQATFSERNALDYPLLSDREGEVARLFGVKRPVDLLKVKRATFVIGQDQRIVEVITSEVNMNVHAERALAALAD